LTPNTPKVKKIRTPEEEAHREANKNVIVLIIGGISLIVAGYMFNGMWGAGAVGGLPYYIALMVQFIGGFLIIIGAYTFVKNL
jgi:hypothetical protein